MGLGIAKQEDLFQLRKRNETAAVVGDVLGIGASFLTPGAAFKAIPGVAAGKQH